MRNIFKALFDKAYYYFCPDKIYLNNKFRKVFGRDIDWEHPNTFNEKLQWLKVYDRNPLYTKLVDKYEVRKYVAEKIGEEYLIPLLGVWEKFEDIDFDKLPNQFVLKCTHDSNSVVICRDKATFDFDAARKRIKDHLKRNFYYNAREWPYKNVKPRIIAEQYMEDQSTKELRDYKIFAFDGVAKALFIASDRLNDKEDTKFDFFDVDFKRIDLRQGHPNSMDLPHKPESFDKMVELAARISEGFPETRVDFYEVNGKAYFGEITLFHHSGFVPFDPEEWDTVFGSWITLPDSRGGGYCLISDGFVLWVHSDDSSIDKDNNMEKWLKDYKFFCFAGKPRFMYISNDHGTNPTTDFFDMEFRHLNIRMKDPNSLQLPSRPEKFSEMKQLAMQLSEGLKHVRVDFYCSSEKVLFGELTFFHCSGFSRIYPEDMDQKIGELIQIDK